MQCVAVNSSSLFLNRCMMDAPQHREYTQEKTQHTTYTCICGVHQNQQIVKSRNLKRLDAKVQMIWGVGCSQLHANQHHPSSV